MNERTKLEQERKELNTLIGNGVSFEIKDVVYDTTRRYWGLIKRRVQREVTRRYTIAEPTLATLDRLSLELVELAIDENELRDKDSIKYARTLAHLHARRAARIVAIAVLGEDRLIAKPGKGGTTQWKENTAKLDELTDLFCRVIKPSRLYQLLQVVSAMSNLGDFVNSIRLMSIERTTVPNRIEDISSAD